MKILNWKSSKNKKSENSDIEENLLSIPGVREIKFKNKITSSVTTSWGVNWNAENIARDILQNFRDANKKFIHKIKSEANGNLISVTAPNTFDLRALYYVGSNKKNEDDNIGQYGEGFKAAIVSLINAGIESPISISGNEACIISVGESIDDDLDLKPLVYNFYKINKFSGSGFYIRTNKSDFIQAFETGLVNFWYEENPILGDKLHEYNDISIYSSAQKNGAIFYAGIKRSEILDIPIIININRKYAVIEKKIKADRDRKTFDDRLTSSLYSIIFKSGFHYSTGTDNKAIQYIFEKTRIFWQNGKGHPILKSIATNLVSLKQDKEFFKKLFKDDFFSKSSLEASNIDYWEYRELESDIALSDRKFIKNNKKELPSYFSSFNVLSSAEKIIVEKKELEEKTKIETVFPPNRQQYAAIEFCFNSLGVIAPELRGLFSSVYAGLRKSPTGSFISLEFKCVQSDALLGQLRDNRSDYNSHTVYLNEKIFSDTFGRFFSTFVHELLHIFGRDGDRQFTDSLTRVIENMIDNSENIVELTEKWRDYKLDKKIKNLKQD